MILVILWDGLRPDTISAQDTPNLHKMAAGGVICRSSHSVFPTATRLNSASLTTGCYPRQHGLVANALYVPGINPNGQVTCGDWNVLRRLAELEGGPVLHTPTLGQMLKPGGKKAAFCGSGSTGTSYLSDPAATGPVVNWSTAWPAKVREDILRSRGSFLGSETTRLERSRFVVEIAEGYILPEHKPDVLTVWLAEPDHTQHVSGLGSPQVKTMLKELDDVLAAFLTAVKRDCGEENLTCLFLSDHGFNTITERVDPNERLAQAGLKESAESTEIVFSASNIYLNTSRAKDSLADVVSFLKDEPWVGGIFLRQDLLDACPGMMAQSAVFSGSHPRSAEITISFRWSADENSHGIPGSVASSSKNIASHGSASPFAVNNTFLAWGAGIKKGVVSAVPCGTVDVAPTVLHLLGQPQPTHTDGRILHELLAAGPAPDSVGVVGETRECSYESKGRALRQIANYSVVDGHRYLDNIVLDG